MKTLSFVIETVALAAIAYGVLIGMFWLYQLHTLGVTR